MGYEDLYRLSVHAVITNSNKEVLFVKTSYGAKAWTLPGGAIDPGESIHEALIRECKEELNRTIKINYLSGVYYHEAHNSHAFIFQCEFEDDLQIELSDEHTEFGFLGLDEMKASHREKVRHCFEFNGTVVSGIF